MADPQPYAEPPASRPAETAGVGVLIVVPIVVVLIAGVAFSVYGYFAWSRDPRETPASAECERLTVLQRAIFAYSQERGALPPAPSSALVRALASPSKRGAPYLEIPAHALTASGELLDGWGAPVCYRLLPESTPPGGRRFELYSFGPNGKDEGGAGDDVLAGD